MSAHDRHRWDRRHSEGPDSDQPASFLREILESERWSIIPGRALDVATGQGRNAIFLAERGFDVTAIDISPVALNKGRRRAAQRAFSISWQQADLEPIDLPAAAYDLVVNINYLQRSLIARIKSAVKSGGHIIFETYLIDQQTVGHPKNPAYLLGHNELLELFRDFRVLYYHEGEFAGGQERAFRAGIFARKIS